MARYIVDRALNQPIDVISMGMEDYLYHNRFTRTDWNGEPVYCSRDDHGKEKYLVWSYASGILHLEAWVKGLFGGESGLNGSARAYGESLERLLERLQQHSGNMGSVGYIGQDPFLHEQGSGQGNFSGNNLGNFQGNFSGNNPGNGAMPAGVPAGMPGGMPGGVPAGMPGGVPGGMPGGVPAGMPGGMPAGAPAGMPVGVPAQEGMVMGILGIVMSFLVPFMGILIGAIGLSKCRMADTSAGKGKRAKILCVTAIVIGSVIIAGGILLSLALPILL